jgi:lambda family phage portal protein
MSLVSRVRYAVASARVAFAARGALSALKKSPNQRVYLAAAAHRLLGAWGITSISADLELQHGQNVRLRSRARDIAQNTALGARYAQLRRDNIVGPTGPTLRVQFSNKRLNKAIEWDWYEWSRRCTPDGRSLRDVLAQLAEARGVEGEGFLQPRPSADAAFGLLVQPYEADQCDDGKMQELPDGGRIVMGVEFTRTSAIRGYWMLSEHPGSGRPRQSEFYSVDRMYRHANRPRIGQARGVTKMAPVMVLMHHLDRLTESLVVLHRICAAKMGYYVQTKDDALPLNPPKDPEETQKLGPQPGSGAPIEEVEPGMMGALAYGWEPKLFDPGMPTQQYDAMAQDLKREISAGLGVSPHSLSNNYRDANYGSQRGSLEPERDMWRAEQAALEEDILAPLLAEFVRIGVVTGRYFIAGYRPGQLIPSTWDHRKWRWIDPLKDAAALLVKLKNGLTTLTKELSDDGIDIDEQIAVIKDERKKLADAGVSLEFMAITAIAAAQGSANQDDDDEEDDPKERAANARARALLVTTHNREAA